MLSSVSSECAFSQSGITVSKHCSCLKGDIVEALQCIKCAIQHNLLSQEPAPSSVVEAEEITDEELEDAALDNSGEPEEESDVEAFSWDKLLVDDDDDDNDDNDNDNDDELMSD
jgi:hypothetical protein